MRRLLLVLSASALFAACTTVTGPPTEPNDREWNLLTADYAWIESLRKAQPRAPPIAPRKQMTHIELGKHRKSDESHQNLMGKPTSHLNRTHDPPPAHSLAPRQIL